MYRPSKRIYDMKRKAALSYRQHVKANMKTKFLAIIKDDNVEEFSKNNINILDTDYIRYMFKVDAFKCLKYIKQQEPDFTFKLNSVEGISKKALVLYKDWFEPLNSERTLKKNSYKAISGLENIASLPDKAFKLCVGNYILPELDQEEDTSICKLFSDEKILIMLKYGINIFGSKVPFELFQNCKFPLIKKLAKTYHFRYPIIPQSSGIYQLLIDYDEVELFKELFLLSGQYASALSYSRGINIYRYVVMNGKKDLLMWLLPICPEKELELVFTEATRLGEIDIVKTIMSRFSNPISVEEASMIYDARNISEDYGYTEITKLLNDKLSQKD